MKRNSVTLTTGLSLPEAADVIHDAVASMGGVVDPVDQCVNQVPDERPDVAVVGSRTGLTDVWAVHASLTQLPDTISVELVALGGGKLVRAGEGARSTASLTKSTPQMYAIVDAMRSADPALQLR
jgi:hypothetical protein